MNKPLNCVITVEYIPYEVFQVRCHCGYHSNGFRDLEKAKQDKWAHQEVCELAAESWTAEPAPDLPKIDSVMALTADRLKDLAYAGETPKFIDLLQKSLTTLTNLVGSRPNLFTHLTEDQKEVLSDIVSEWIGEGFTTPPYSDAHYDIFEALGLDGDRGMFGAYNTRRPE